MICSSPHSIFYLRSCPAGLQAIAWMEQICLCFRAFSPALPDPRMLISQISTSLSPVLPLDHYKHLNISISLLWTTMQKFDPLPCFLSWHLYSFPSHVSLYNTYCLFPLCCCLLTVSSTVIQAPWGRHFCLLNEWRNNRIWLFAFILCPT